MREHDRTRYDYVFAACKGRFYQIDVQNDEIVLIEWMPKSISKFQSFPSVILFHHPAICFLVILLVTNQKIDTFSEL